MPITVHCSECGVEFRVKDSAAGRQVACRNCGAGIQVASSLGSGKLPPRVAGGSRKRKKKAPQAAESKADQFDGFLPKEWLIGGSIVISLIVLVVGFFVIRGFVGNRAGGGAESVVAENDWTKSPDAYLSWYEENDGRLPVTEDLQLARNEEIEWEVTFEGFVDEESSNLAMAETDRVTYWAKEDEIPLWELVPIGTAVRLKGTGDMGYLPPDEDLGGGVRSFILGRPKLYSGSELEAAGIRQVDMHLLIDDCLYDPSTVNLEQADLAEAQNLSSAYRKLDGSNASHEPEFTEAEWEAMRAAVFDVRGRLLNRSSAREEQFTKLVVERFGDESLVAHFASHLEAASEPRDIKTCLRRLEYIGPAAVDALSIVQGFKRHEDGGVDQLAKAAEYAILAGNPPEITHAQVTVTDANSIEWSIDYRFLPHQAHLGGGPVHRYAPDNEVTFYIRLGHRIGFLTEELRNLDSQATVSGRTDSLFVYTGDGLENESGQGIDPLELGQFEVSIVMGDKNATYAGEASSGSPDVDLVQAAYDTGYAFSELQGPWMDDDEQIWTFQHTSITVESVRRVEKRFYGLVVDASQSPMHIEFAEFNKPIQLGLFTFENNDLILEMGTTYDRQAEIFLRPMEFKTPERLQRVEAIP